MPSPVHIAKSLFAAAALRSGFIRRWHRRQGPHVLVLAYHRVTPDAEMAECAYPAMHVSTRSFEAQLGALRELYRVIPMADLETILAGTVPLREPVAVVTFDDGYRDNYRNALPILVRQAVPATFFLSVDFVERQRGFWFDRLADAARVWDRDPSSHERLRVALPEPAVAALAGPGSWRERVRAAAAHLKTLPDREREAAIAALDPVTGRAASPHSEPLRWDEVQAMQRAGMRIGAHGVRHGILTRMPQPAAAAEIHDSLALLRQRAGMAVSEFAYPNGDADANIARVAAEAGVRLGFTMQHCSLRPGDDRLRLGRRNVCEDTSRGASGQFSQAYFWCEITGIFDAVLRREARQG